MNLREQLLACEPNFENTSLDPEKSIRPKAPIEPVKSDTDAIENAIYAADERGWPTSAQAWIMSKDPNPEVAQYVQSRLMNGQKSGGVDDPDFALDSVQRDGESNEAYAERLKGLLNPNAE